MRPFYSFTHNLHGMLLIHIFIILLGNALRCWTCNSAYDVTCRDYFNLTRIAENTRYHDSASASYGHRQTVPVGNDPQLKICDDMYTTTYNQKNVCLKRVSKGPNGLPVVRRLCQLVPKSLKVGECPDDMRDQTKDIEFCSTCEYDGCNAAAELKTNVILASIISVSLLLVLRN
ncbi:hypothetical protein NQ314_000759 [Rhamnusium bicolor]|uniref:Protein sleepless n=1 Tax=Rhamnusium bicolor TaxID=1586634 RepID=A0AAV8ZX70_9CUCU|nr:hypothetical protein NQ314_000759 [Rhamnusium bicolor]